LGFTNNLFGAIAGLQGSLVRPAPDFIPIDGSGKTLQLTNTSANWLGLRSRQMQYWAYVYCAPLSAVIDKLSECDINGELEAIKTDGTEDYSQSNTVKRLMNLLNRPNPIQSWEDFRAEQVAYKKIFGFCPVFPIIPKGFTDPTYATSIWNLLPWLCTPQINSDFNIYSTSGTPVKRWTMSIFGQAVTIDGDKIMMLTDGIVKDSGTQYMLPLSKVAGLDYAVSNCCYSQEADNVLLRKKGPIGAWSHDPLTDSVKGYLPMKQEEKLELQKDLAEYGLSWDQFQFLVTRQRVKYVSAGFNVKELMTKETFNQGVEIICDKFGVPAELLSFKDAKYENRAAAEKFMYQNVIIPGNTRDMRVYTNFFGLNKLDTPVKLRCDFDELPIMQDDMGASAKAMLDKTDAVNNQYKDGYITKNMARQQLGYDSIEGQDYYYTDSPEYKVTQEQFKIKQNAKSNPGADKAA
jgi:hypothetical protein